MCPVRAVTASCRNESCFPDSPRLYKHPSHDSAVIKATMAPSQTHNSLEVLSRYMNTHGIHGAFGNCNSHKSALHYATLPQNTDIVYKEHRKGTREDMARCESCE
ncbi:hypothetical protein CHARACLAT_009396 [Characodon lateralis]|uniref:Uncharacterized protein n=1 Tax=Characodon lateralis TaxID=208331 RepID=A0ABU7EHN1_9TELE|nr:hypothetical protein [Characodon lateralis]